MKRSFRAKLIGAFVLVATFCCLNNVNATTYSKSLTASHSTTTIRATTKYYTDATTRWSVGSPVILSTSGKGGASSKSGDSVPWKNGANYYVSQKYSISATDFNYNTTQNTKTFQWSINGTTNTWVTSECKVS